MFILHQTENKYFLHKRMAIIDRYNRKRTSMYLYGNIFTSVLSAF